MSLNDQGFNQFYKLLKMKKKFSSIGVILEKVEQQLINGGNDNCNYYASRGLCFGDNDPYCIPCNLMSNYPGAASCINLDTACFDL